MTFSDTAVDDAIRALGALDKDLLLGKCTGWGSWMFTSGGYMCSIGLGTNRDGSIKFDTPLAKAVIAKLTADAPKGSA